MSCFIGEENKVELKYTHVDSLLGPNKFMLAQSAKATEKP